MFTRVEVIRLEKSHFQTDTKANNPVKHRILERIQSFYSVVKSFTVIRFFQLSPHLLNIAILYSPL